MPGSPLRYSRFAYNWKLASLVHAITRSEVVDHDVVTVNFDVGRLGNLRLPVARIGTLFSGVGSRGDLRFSDSSSASSRIRRFLGGSG
jgi:hypothetical protein